MRRTLSILVLFLVVASAFLGACAKPTPQIVRETVVVEKVVEKPVEVVKVVTPTPEPLPTATTKITFDQALAEVKAKFPAKKYMTNMYLPQEPVTGPTSGGPKKTYKIKVGMPWILNDEEAPWYNAKELGYFAEEGLEVEFVSGGPGVNHLQTVGGGTIDILIAAGGQGIPSAVASRTPIDLVAVGTFLKGMPYCLIAIDPKLVGRSLTPLDLLGKTVGYQGNELYIQMLLDKYGIPRNKVKTMEVGWDLSALLVGKIDYYPGWIMNQPRLLPAGQKWNALMYRDWVYDEYSDVIAVRRDKLATEDGKDMVRRFLRATYRGLRFLLDNPDKSADIAVIYGAEAKLTKDQALARFALQKDLVIGRDGLGLMSMSPEKWNEMVATLFQYEQIELPESVIKDLPQ